MYNKSYAGTTDVINNVTGDIAVNITTNTEYYTAGLTIPYDHAVVCGSAWWVGLKGGLYILYIYGDDTVFGTVNGISFTTTYPNATEIPLYIYGSTTNTDKGGDCRLVFTMSNFDGYGLTVYRLQLIKEFEF